MLTAVPKNWFSWNFSLRETLGGSVAELRLSSLRERGSVVIDGTTYTIYRKGLLGPFIMERLDGSVVASATKPSVFRREFSVADVSGSYVLKATSAFRRRCEVFRESRPIGSIEPESWLGRRARVQFAAEISPVLQAFLVWLTLLLWQREASSAAAGGA